MLGINSDPVTIKQVEVSIIDRAWESGWVTPSVPDWLSGKRAAVVGSGPAGLAAAQQLARAGHTVTVYERADRAGGLLRYGIPEFKMEKSHLDRRLAQMEAEGVTFRNGVEAGIDITARELRKRHDVVVLTVGATAARELPVPGRELAGIHQAMEYLPLSNQVCEGTLEATPIDAAGRHVVIIGGGDTGADCLGTAHRQGAASVTQLEILPLPPETRPESAPWPTYPMIYRVSSAHEEGGDRVYAVSTKEFLGDERGPSPGAAPGRGRAGRRAVHGGRGVRARAARGPGAPGDGLHRSGARARCWSSCGSPSTTGATSCATRSYATSVKGVFVAGDAGRGQSLIVWAIAEGRAAAAAVDAYLMGSTNLPAPIPPTARQLLV